MLVYLTILFGLIAIFCAAASMRRAARPLAQRIDALLPQTQCRQCGHAGCEPYALALASGSADIDQCPPGGERLIRRLARLLDVEVKPLDAARGEHKPRALALIDEAACIGCTLCIQACPVDAIVGAPKLMHTVIAGECTGCELCIAPCPVDCISMTPAPLTRLAWLSGAERARAARARRRYHSRQTRLARDRQERSARLAQRAAAKRASSGDQAAAERKQAIIAAAMERARHRLAENSAR
jgi:electron transport complex protein RnfB